MWTNTCCSHPLVMGDEMKEENAWGVRLAAQRKVNSELGQINYNIQRTSLLSFNVFLFLLFSKKKNLIHVFLLIKFNLFLLFIAFCFVIKPILFVVSVIQRILFPSMLCLLFTLIKSNQICLNDASLNWFICKNVLGIEPSYVAI